MYTEAKSKRGAGLGPAWIGEGWMSGMMLFIAVKSIAGALSVLPAGGVAIPPEAASAAAAAAMVAAGAPAEGSSMAGADAAPTSDE